MYFIQYVTFHFDGKFTSYDYLRIFRKICGKYREEMCGKRKEIRGNLGGSVGNSYREEMWEINQRNLGARNLCQKFVPEICARA